MHLSRKLFVAYPLAVLTLLAFVQGCGAGYDNPLFEDSNENPFKQIIIAPGDLENFDHEYMVGFKTNGTSFGAMGGAANFQLRQSVNQTFFAEFVETGEVADIEFISELNITDPSKKSKNVFERFMELGFPARSFDLTDQRSRLSLVKFKDRETAELTLRDLAERNLIWYAEPNWKSKLTAESDDYFNSISETYGSDTSNYWVTTTRLAQTYAQIAALTSEQKTNILNNPPVIAILDSGVDIEHPALSNQIYKNTTYQNTLCTNDQFGCNTSEDYKKGFLGDGNIFPATTSGFSQQCDTAQDIQGTCVHGTHVSGIAAGSPLADGGNSVPGMCPFCKIMVLKIVKSKVGGSGKLVPSGISDSAILRALQYISAFSQNGERIVRVANSSFGKYQRSRSVALMVRLISEQGRGILLVGAASNEDSMERAYPASLPDAIAVAAVQSDLKKAPYSNVGTWVDISAPGSAINSSKPGGGKLEQQGTSMAAPVVTGIAGLIFALEPNLTAPQVKLRLMETADPSFYDVPFNKNNYFPPISSGDPTPLLGTGVVDSYGAITNQKFDISRLNPTPRVEAGCSFIGKNSNDHSKHSPTKPILYLVIFLLPLGLVLISYFKKNAKK